MANAPNTTVLKKLGDINDNLTMILNEQDALLTGISGQVRDGFVLTNAKLERIDDRLRDEFERVMLKLNGIFFQHGEKLDGIAGTLNDHGERLDQLVTGQQEANAILERISGALDAHGVVLERIARSLEGKRRDEGDVLNSSPGKQA